MGKGPNKTERKAKKNEIKVLINETSFKIKMNAF